MSNHRPRPAGSPSPDARLSALSGRQAAWIGALAAVLATLVSVPVTIWTAHSASEAAIDAVRVQALGETERSRAEFLRGQRQDLYVQVIEHEEDLYIAEVHYRGLLADALEARRPPVLSTSITQFAPLLAKLAVDEHSLDLIGSEAVQVAHEDLRQAHADYLDALFQMGDDINAQRIQGPFDQVAEAQTEVLRLEKQLAIAGRADMGV